MKKHSYGYVRDFIDPRDKPFKAAKKGAHVPDIVNLNALQSPVQDQGNLGSCVGQGAVGALEYLLLKNAKKEMVQRMVQGKPFFDLSPLQLYYDARKLDGTVSEDAGTQIRSAIKALANTGVCREDLWPYLITKFAEKPSQVAYVDAKTRIITSYRRLYTVSDRLNCLAQGNVFIFGVTVFKSFESAATEKTGIIKMPGKNEGVVGGHCMLCTGHNKKTELFDLKNSYGLKWGKKGFGQVEFEYMEAFASDNWEISQMKF